MPDQSDALALLSTKLDLVSAKLDLLLSQRAASPPVASTQQVLPPKVTAALMRRGGTLPREARIRMRSAAIARILDGESEDRVVKAIDNGEGVGGQAAQSLLAAI